MSPLMLLQYGMTALMWAVINGRTETATLLLDKGVDIDAKDKVRIDIGMLSHVVSVP